MNHETDLMFGTDPSKEGMTSKALIFLQQRIGKEAADAPSPLMRWLKPVLLSAETGKLSFQYRVRKEWTNPMGTLHGGNTAAIVDDAIGATLFSFGEDHFYTTISNVVDYFLPARLHDSIRADTSIVKKGRQIVHAQCDIWEGDRLVARGYSTLMKTDIKKEDKEAATGIEESFIPAAGNS